MDAPTLSSFLQHLGVSPESIIVDNHRGWVRCPCPYAAWTHEKGYDSKPSFGITIVEENGEADQQPSVGYCFTCMSYCGAKALPTLAQAYWSLSKVYPQGAMMIAASSKADYDYNYSDHMLLFQGDTECKSLLQGEPSLKRLLHFFPRMSEVNNIAIRDNAENYLSYRNVPVSVQRFYDIRYCTLNGNIAFPMTTDEGEICHYRLRKPYTKDIFTFSHKYIKDMAQYSDVIFPRIVDTGAFFGAHTLIKGDLPIIVVEGEIDAMVWFSLGFNNVIATATTSITEAHFSRLFSWTDRIILGFDTDKAGQLATKKTLEKADAAGCSVYMINWAAAGLKDAGAVTTPEHKKSIIRATNRLTIR